MAETNMRAVHAAVTADLVALARVINDLEDVSEQMGQEELFPHFQREAKQVLHTISLAARRLAEMNREYALHADARDDTAPDPLGNAPRVIDQPVSPATPPTHKE